MRYEIEWQRRAQMVCSHQYSSTNVTLVRMQDIIDLVQMSVGNIKLSCCDFFGYGGSERSQKNTSTQGLYDWLMMLRVLTRTLKLHGANCCSLELSPEEYVSLSCIGL